MKVQKIIKNDVDNSVLCGYNDKTLHPYIWKEEYMFAPNQLVKVRLHDIHTKNFIDTVCLVKKITYDDFMTPCPTCTIEYYNLWSSGDASGGMEFNMVLHRYISPEKITKKEINSWKNHPESKNIFYVEENNENGWDVIHPFIKK